MWRTLWREIIGFLWSFGPRFTGAFSILAAQLVFQFSIGVFPLPNRIRFAPTTILFDVKGAAM
jgi:hypothetical protein